MQIRSTSSKTEALDEYWRYQSIPQMTIICWHHFYSLTHTPVKYTIALTAQELAQHFGCCTIVSVCFLTLFQRFVTSTLKLVSAIYFVKRAFYSQN